MISKSITKGLNPIKTAVVPTIARSNKVTITILVTSEKESPAVEKVSARL